MYPLDQLPPALSCKATMLISPGNLLVHIVRYPAVQIIVDVVQATINLFYLQT